MGGTPYEIELLPSAERQLEKLPRDAQEPVRDTIEGLARDPRPFGCDQLAGPDRLFRIRTGQYRIIYQIHDKRLVVLVVRVADRREVYNQTFMKRLRQQIRRWANQRD
jgi:mRNA interferase RelE/StbE